MLCSFFFYYIHVIPFCFFLLKMNLKIDSTVSRHIPIFMPLMVGAYSIILYHSSFNISFLDYLFTFFKNFLKVCLLINAANDILHLFILVTEKGFSFKLINLFSPEFWIYIFNVSRNASRL